MTATDHETVSWELIVAGLLLSWFVIAFVVATLVGHMTVLGTRSDSDSE